MHKGNQLCGDLSKRSNLRVEESGARGWRAKLKVRPVAPINEVPDEGMGVDDDG